MFTNIFYGSVAACLPSPAPTPGWRRRRPATPSLRRRRVLLLWATHSPRQSSPSHPHHQVPPDTTKATLILVKMAINPIKSIAGFPTTKPLYPNIPGKWTSTPVSDLRSDAVISLPRATASGNFWSQVPSTTITEEYSNIMLYILTE